MLRNRAKRKYGTVAQEIQFSEFYRTAIDKNKRVITDRLSHVRFSFMWGMPAYLALKVRPFIGK